MEAALLSALAPLANFYVIMGSSAEALTGLQFVVVALIAQSGGTTSKREIRGFGRPTEIHFCAALVISAVMNIPWLAVSHLAACPASASVARYRISQDLYQETGQSAREGSLRSA